jgi:hypothetical protein
LQANFPAKVARFYEFPSFGQAVFSIINAPAFEFCDQRVRGAGPIEVGTPVTRCPPRRSRHAELPHRAPQESAHMEPAPSQSARNRFPLQAGSLTPCSGVIVSRGGCFACVAFLPAPSPCDRRYRL